MVFWKRCLEVILHDFQEVHGLAITSMVSMVYNDIHKISLLYDKKSVDLYFARHEALLNSKIVILTYKELEY